MNFASPEWFLALILIPLLYWAYSRFMQTRQKAAIKFSNLKLIKRTVPFHKLNRRNKLLFALSMLSLASLIIALTDPHIPLAQTKEGVNVVLVIDVSGSMKAQDYKPNRLEAAKKSAEVEIMFKCTPFLFFQLKSLKKKES